MTARIRHAGALALVNRVELDGTLSVALFSQDVAPCSAVRRAWRYQLPDGRK
jgi:hypothetical protein